MADGVIETGKKKSGCGCFGCGCLVIIGVFFLTVLGIGFFVNKMVVQYTTETPLQLSEVNGTPEEFAAVEEKFKHFVAGLNGTEDAVPLVLTDHEINLFIANEPDLNKMASIARVKIDGDKLGAQINIPLDGSPWSGRYLSGEGTVKASVENGEASIKIQSLSFNGTPIPAEAMKKLSETDIADELFKKPEEKKFLEAVDMVIVKNGKLIIVGKKGALKKLGNAGEGSQGADVSTDEPVSAPVTPMPSGSAKQNGGASARP